MMRKISANESPIWRARLPSFGEQRDTSTEMNTMLSMPRMISSTVRVTSAAQASGSVRSSNIASELFRFGIAQQPGAEKINTDGAQASGDPDPRPHVADQCHNRKHRPCGNEKR